jgi:hypothetical protein
VVQSGIRWALVGVAVLVVVLAATGSTFVEMRSRVGDLVGSDSDGRSQSGAQISTAEFERAHVGTSPEALRAFVGEPEGKSTNRIEGVRIECWYYGMGGTSGSYQLCFVNGKLRSKLVFEP